MQTSQLGSSFAQYHTELTWEAGRQQPRRKPHRAEPILGTQYGKWHFQEKPMKEPEAEREELLLLLEALVSACETASHPDLLPRSLQQDSHGDYLQGTMCQGAHARHVFTSNTGTLMFCKLASVLHAQCLHCCSQWYPGLLWIPVCCTRDLGHPS